MFSRNLEKAREAYLSGDKSASRLAHQAKPAETHQREQGQYIKSVIYGGLDGIITTFAVVAGVAGAALSSGVVLILGFANLIADGLSMAIGDYLSTKSENEYHKAERAREEWEVENFPDGEKKEMLELYAAKGFSAADAQAMVELLAKNKKAWVDTMMTDELKIMESEDSPAKSALVTFFAFVVFGFLPLLIYVLALALPSLKSQSFLFSSLLTGATLFVLGALKVRLTGKKWFVSGLEMLLVGGLAAVAAYGVGALLATFA